MIRESREKGLSTKSSSTTSGGEMNGMGGAGGIRICITDSLCCTAETNNIFNQLYANKKKQNWVMCSDVGEPRLCHTEGFPGGSEGNESSRNAGDLSSILGLVDPL